MAKDDDRVILACEAEWDSWKSDCSGFVKAVAARLGVRVFGNANQLVDFLGNSPDWRDLGHDHNKARVQATLGDFDIAGLKDSPHGHVAIIVGLPSAGFPVGYWGRFGSFGKKKAPISLSWRRPALAQVSYFAGSL
ncbi:hypothetical protein NX773_06290 [Massilia solisilvae]|uniref:NlpC/P60 domain-containing protein n=1 Tax=Massilia solisilvae TaxID=1811225 RepID=A0ABT2BGW8_9BURK|nr:hypothetical protein [Massilia solisilvae]MCS0607769.1 hypothetical protein [Massilia solisilvae]